MQTDVVSDEASEASATDPVRDDLIQRLIGCEAVLFGEFTLTSGAKSAYYVDIKRAMTDPSVLGPIAAAIAPRAAQADVIAGMALGAVPLAVAVSLASGKPFAMVRKEAREHGTGKRIEGPAVAGKRVLVVEDVATSGGSTVQAVEVLRDAGALIDEAWVVVDRESGGAAALAAKDVELHALVRARDLLDHHENTSKETEA